MVENVINLIFSLLLKKIGEEMLTTLSFVISALALIATAIGLGFQREHNEKSLRPYGQIDLRDRLNIVYVYIKNYGLGPMIITKIEYWKNNQPYVDIERTLEINPRSYMHIHFIEGVTRAIMPGQHLELFEAILNESHLHNSPTRDSITKQLSKLNIIVYYKDMYGNKYTASRNLDWFQGRALVLENTNEE